MISQVNHPADIEVNNQAEAGGQANLQGQYSLIYKTRQC